MIYYMALDGIFLHSIVSELKDSIVNAKVDKVNQPEKDELIITIRGMGFTKKLLISASSTYPRIHFTTVGKHNPIQAPMYCMVLRKYLTNSRIIDVRQVSTDRVVVMDFESQDELGFNSVYSLVIEIMGRHSNITLVRKRDNIIMDSIKHITPDINTYRSLYPGIEYISAPNSEKLNPLELDMDRFKAYVSEEHISLDDNLFSSIFTGIGKTLSKEMVVRLRNCNNSRESCSSEELFNFSAGFFRALKENKFHFAAYADSASLKEFYCIKLLTLEKYREIPFSSASELLENFYLEKDKIDRLNNKSSDLQKLLNNNLDRCLKKAEILNKTLEECSSKDKFKVFGELLTANIYSLKKGDKEAIVLNYYSEEEEYLNIRLDEMKTPSENIQYYFKRYNKYKKSEEAASEQLRHNDDEIEYLQSVLTNIRNCETYEEIEEIRNELVTTGYIKFKKEYKSNKQKASKPLHFISSDGLDIYVGKNNLQNDYLTLKFADKHDLWLHTKNIPGSHVIVKNTGAIPDRTLEEAAILAAYYSKAKDSSKVPVDYTEVRNVKKPAGSKPGMVIYYTNKTAYVTPCELNLKKA
jgi:predicted ribosome quality control (RQC) complex YloA/Tae2 family protein